MLGAEPLARSSMPTVADWRSQTSAPVDTSPEIEVVPPTPSPSPLTPPPDLLGPAPMVAGFDEPATGRWKTVAAIILVAGAALIALLWWLRTADPTKPPELAIVTRGGGGGAAAAAPTTVTELAPLVDAAEAPVPVPGPDPAGALDADAPPDAAPSVEVGPAQVEPAVDDPPVDDPAADRRPVKRTPPVRRPPPPKPGKLFLDARPWATIYIDGRKVGVTPLVGVTLTAGEHTIKAVAEDGRTKTMRVMIPAGGDARRKVTW
jgi:serine/threonine-protein kinase